MDLLDDHKVLLCFGGSQGAHSINHMLPHAVELLQKRKYKLQVIQLSGQDENAGLSYKYDQLGIPNFVMKESVEMGALLKKADVVVCRAGASSLAELIHFAASAVLIPYPHAAENHQEINADYANQVENFYKLKESELDNQSLANAIELLFRFSDKSHVEHIYYPRAAEAVLHEIFDRD